MFAFTLMPFDQWCGFMVIGLILALGGALPVLGILRRQGIFEGESNNR